MPSTLGGGIRSMDQPLPAFRSTSGWPPLKAVWPTATQARLELHDTATRPLDWPGARGVL
jgi:hypothetical protein